MAEFRLGRLKFNWTGAWQPDTAYVLDDIVSLNGNTYVCVVNHTSAGSIEQWETVDVSRWDLYTPGINSTGSWLPNQFYAKNDLARYGGNIYICTDNHTSPANQTLFYTPTSFSNWELFFEGTENKDIWLQNTWYKVNDLVKYGNNIYKCHTGHTSTTMFDPTKFDVYLEAVKFEDTWSSSTEYQPGDIVLFGGYSYVAKTINTNKQPNTYINDDWEVISVGFKSQGLYSNTTVYVPGDVIRYGGNTFVKLITSAAGIAPNESGDGALKWGLISEGLAYKGEWSASTTYQKNDVVTLASSSYVSLGYSNLNNNPGTQAPGNWSVLSEGDEESTLTVKGDLLFRQDATNARLPIGDPGQVLYATENGLPGWGNAKSRKVYYVNLDGVDDFADGYGGSPGRAFRTIKYATEIATQEGCGEQTPASIYVKAGVYNEICPITVPPYCAVIGDDSRGSIVQPGPGTSKIQVLTIGTNCLLVPGDTLRTRNGSGAISTHRVLHFTDGYASPVGTNVKRRIYVENLTGNPAEVTNTFLNGTGATPPETPITAVENLANTKATLFFLSEGVMVKDMVMNNPDPNAGFVAPPTGSFDPVDDEEEYNLAHADIRQCNVGFVFFRINPTVIAQTIIKSPYVYSSAAYSHRGIGALVDGSINENRDHPSHFAAGHQSMLFGNFTQFHEDGVGIWCKDNGNSEIVSSFTYYCHIGYASSGGSRMRSLGGNNSWGNYGCTARGFDINEVPLEATVRGSELNLLNSTVTGTFQRNAIIDNSPAANTIQATGVSGNGTTATVTFAALSYVPYEVNKYIVVDGFNSSPLTTLSSFAVTSTSVTDGGAAPARLYGTSAGRPAYASAQNFSPQLSWTNIAGQLPAGVTVSSYEIYMEDINETDLDGTPILHWHLKDIPAGVTSIAENQLPTGASPQSNDYGNIGNTWVRSNGYSGPQPPLNEQNHTFRIVVRANLDGSASKPTASIEFTAGNSGATAPETLSATYPNSLTVNPSANVTGYNGTWQVTACTTNSVSFNCSETLAPGVLGNVRPKLARAQILYVLPGNDYTKLLIEPLTGYIGNGTVVTQITGAEPGSFPALPAPIGTTVTPNPQYPADPITGAAANRPIRGSKFPTINLPEKPKITSAVTFTGDTLNYVIQNVEFYSQVETFKTLNASRTSSVSDVTIPVARTGTQASPVVVAPQSHLGGTDVTLYKLLSGTSNQTIIDNPGSLETSDSATQINVLEPERVQAALDTYNTASTTLFLLVGNELMRPLSVVDDQFNSYVVVERAREGTIATTHADQDSPTYPQNAVVRFVVKHTPVTTIRQDLTNLSANLTYNPSTKNGGIPIFSYTSDEGNAVKTIENNDFIKIGNEFFKVTLKTTVNPGTAILTFYPTKVIPEVSGSVLKIRYRYSQIRLTGHDFLEIGTGGIATTNFPAEPQIRPNDVKEISFEAPARIYYVTTNQDGNFKVGQFFRIDQATGVSTIDASAFALTGITSLKFSLPDGSIVGVEVNKFDSDVLLGGVDTSDSFVPTQKAVKTYVDNVSIDLFQDSFSTDITLGGVNTSDTKIPSQKAVKAYVDNYNRISAANYFIASM